MPDEIQIILGDCAEKLTSVPSESVQLVFTSPPYADQRKQTYGGVHPDKYVEWFLPISHELQRVLKPRGTFILNIKERVVNGERHTYVLDLIKALRDQGWLWTEEFIWHKKNSYPGKWPNRFRDSWARLILLLSMVVRMVKMPIIASVMVRIGNFVGKTSGGLYLAMMTYI